MDPATDTACALRLATEGDAAIIMDMMLDFNQGEHIPWTREAGEGPLRRLLGDAQLGWVFLIYMSGREGALLGYSIITPGYDLEFGGRDGFMTELYLCPETRGRGLGRAALAALLQEAKGRGLGALHLQVREDNLVAQRLYEKAGFVWPQRRLLTRVF